MNTHLHDLFSSVSYTAVSQAPARAQSGDHASEYWQGWTGAGTWVEHIYLWLKFGSARQVVYRLYSSTRLHGTYMYRLIQPSSLVPYDKIRINTNMQLCTDITSHEIEPLFVVDAPKLQKRWKG